MNVEGSWKVKREAGLLPPFVRKRIGPDAGWTLWFGVPVGKFIRAGDTLRYRLWPVRDELREENGEIHGRGLLLGREFCRFRLEPA